MGFGRQRLPVGRGVSAGQISVQEISGSDRKKSDASDVEKRGREKESIKVHPIEGARDINGFPPKGRNRGKAQHKGGGIKFHKTS